MDLQVQLALSHYEAVTPLSSAHCVDLVRRRDTGLLCVRKQVHTDHAELYRYLQADPVPHTPRIFELVDTREALWVFEEFISGETLQALLDRTGPLPEQQVLSVALQLSRIAASLHRRTPPVIHRDIKPSNLILSASGELWLLDFDAAKPAAALGSSDTRLLGTHGFAAPEQYGFAGSDARADIYAIGAVLNVLLTGKLPQEQPAKGILAPVIRKCTAMDRNDRYSSASELQEDLETLLPGQKRRMPVRRRFLPPGFRSNSLGLTLFSAVAYGLLVLVCFSMKNDTCSPGQMWYQRIVFLLMCLSYIFVTGNYAGLHRHFRLASSSRLPLKLFGIFLLDLLLTLFWILFVGVFVI